VTETVDFLHVPLLVRENSIIAVGSDEEKPAWRLNDELTLHLFQLADGAEVSLRLAASEGGGTTRFVFRRDAQKFTLSSDGQAKNVRLMMRGVQAASEIGNGRLIGDLPEGSLLAWADTAEPISFAIRMAETPPVEGPAATNPVRK